jgi:hypothetical protein
VKELLSDFTFGLEDQPKDVRTILIGYSYYAGRRPNDERAGYPDTGDDPKVMIMGLHFTDGSRLTPVGAAMVALLTPMAEKLVLAHEARS